MLTHFGTLLLICGLIGFSGENKKALIQGTACDYKVKFTIVTDSLWYLREDETNTQSIDLALKIENQGDAPLRFPLMDNYTLSIKYNDGGQTDMEGGLDNLTKVRPISDPVNLGESCFLNFKGRLWRDTYDQMQLTFYDDFGNIWQLGPLRDEWFRIGMTYAAEPPSDIDNQDLWCGEADVSAVPIRVIPD